MLQACRRLSASFLCGLLILLASGCPEKPSKPPQSGPEQTAEASPPPQMEEGFEALTLDEFVPFQAEETTWSESDGLILCTGVPKGYAYSKESYDDFTLRCDFQFSLTKEQQADPLMANTGFMIHIQKPHRVWPASLEVQGRADEMASIKSNGGVPALMIDDHPDVRERVRKSPEEWNSVEIISRNGALTSFLNGEEICTSQPGKLTSGKIGLQAEGYVVRFRNLRIRRDSADEKELSAEQDSGDNPPAENESTR